MIWLILLMGCDAPSVAPRVAGERTGRASACDALDPTHCLLPWPSAAFLDVDASRPTGLSVTVEQDSLDIDDDLSLLTTADGFSRASPLAVGFMHAVEDAGSDDPTGSLAADSVLQLFIAEPDHARYGERIALTREWVDGSTLSRERHLLLGHAVELMPPDAEHLAIVTRAVGSAAEAPRAVEVALELVAPASDEEEAVWAYFAPARELLADAGIEATDVVRLWDFTTRSEEDGTRRLLSMAEQTAATEADWSVELDEVVFPEDEALDAIVTGRLVGLPDFLDATGHYVLDADGLPEVQGTLDATFRLTVPAVDGYRVALYGHGTGGDVDDDSFDEELARAGIAKLNLRFIGWTGEDVIETFFGFTAMIDGASTSAAGLAQVLAGGTALLTAMEELIPAAVHGETLDGVANPAADTWPDVSEPVWVGGSLGGTTGAVFVGAEPRIETAVLNVPGAGWTHFLAQSYLYEIGLGELMLADYGNELELRLAIAMSQTAWDDADGVVWAERALEPGGVLLLQESMGDPVLPNPGTELLASALGAVQLETVLSPVAGLQTTDGLVTEGAALQQFRVPDTGPYDVHGFAARDTPAGAAAMEQMTELLESYWEGAAQVGAPAGCSVTEDGSCDFSESW